MWNSKLHKIHSKIGNPKYKYKLCASFYFELMYIIYLIQ